MSSAAGGCADTASARTVRYGYDARQRLTTVNVQGDVSTAQYLADGRLDQVTHPNGTSVDYTYHDEAPSSGEAHNRVHRILHSGASGPIADVQYRYDPNGTQREVRRWIQGAGSSTTTYDYDALGRLVDEQEQTGLGTTHRTYDYGTGYNREGSEVFRDGSLSENLTYTYDDADRLLSVVDAVSNQATAYAYDANGNTLSRQIQLKLTCRSARTRRGWGSLLARVGPGGAMEAGFGRAR